MTATLLGQIERWRRTIATEIAASHPHLSNTQRHQAIQQFIDRVFCLHLWAQRGLFPLGEMRSLHHGSDAYARLQQLWQVVNDRLGRVSPIVPLIEMAIDDKIVSVIVREMGDRWFSGDDLMPAEVLGQVYEQSLTQPIGDKRLDDAWLDHKTDPKQRENLRKTGGAYYTPVAIVNDMVRLTVGRLVSPNSIQPIRVLDPACGGGAFLLAAYQYLLDCYLQGYVATDPGQHAKAGLIDAHQGKWRLTIAERTRILLNCIYGVDIDPQAVHITRMALLLKLFENVPQPAHHFPDLSRNVQCGNALIASDCATQAINPDAVNAFDWETAFAEIIKTGGFDVVIGNPPYIDSEWMSRYLPEWRTYCTTHYRTAVGNWDIFCVFIEKALSLCRSGGLTSFVVPNKLASANYAVVARSLLTREHHLLSLHDYSRASAFSVAVYPLVYVAQNAKPQLDAQVLYEVMKAEGDGFCVAECRHFHYGAHFRHATTPWLMAASSQSTDLLTKLRQSFSPLAAWAEITGAATVAEAYELKALIQDQSVIDPGDLPLVNSGTIDRYCFLWGKKPLRYLGNLYHHPVVPVEQLKYLPQKRYDQALQPKIVIAGMTKELECAIDLQGGILAAKSTSIVRLKGDVSLDLRYLLGVLNSRLISLYFTSSFGGNSLSGGYLRVGPPQLRQIPLPKPDLTNLVEQTTYEDVIDWVDRILSLHAQLRDANGAPRQTIQQQIETANQAIDRLVCQLYQLTDPEIDLVLAVS